MKKKFTAFVSLLLAVVFALCQPVQAAKMPKPNAAVTQKNIMAILNAYDADGAYIMQEAIDDGRDITQWWHFGNTLVSNALGTAVHEECHHYIHGTYSGERIYIGNKKSIQIEYTDVYHTKEMAKSVPKKLRTFRFDTYISKPSDNLAANVCGAYGLLNEFTAYCWGMNTSVSLYPYFKLQKPDGWLEYAGMCASDRLAYAEFKYYILHYLYYAKVHHPDVYRGIMKNKKFARAFTRIEKKYAKLNAVFESRLNSVVKMLNKNGHWARYEGGYLWIDNHGVGIAAEGYDDLLKEMEKTKYQKIMKALQG